MSAPDSNPPHIDRRPDDVREALRAALAIQKRHQAGPGLGRESAVLLPLFARDEETHLWLLKRSDSLRRHQGQVAFPGGMRDAEDSSLAHTALREANEEVGLEGLHVEVLGALDDLVTGTGYVITPYVAWVAPEFAPVPNPAEVARVFSAPLRTFLEAPSGDYPRIGWQVEGEIVWGATCAMIINLMNALRKR